MHLHFLVVAKSTIALQQALLVLKVLDKILCEVNSLYAEFLH